LACPRSLTEAMEGSLFISISHAASMPTAPVRAFVSTIGPTEASVAFTNTFYAIAIGNTIRAHTASLRALFCIAGVLILAIDPHGSYFAFAVLFFFLCCWVDSLGTCSTLFVAFLGALGCGGCGPTIVPMKSRIAFTLFFSIAYTVAIAVARASRCFGTRFRGNFTHGFQGRLLVRCNQ